ncbi:MAG: MlaE family ABC transporter permease [Planctomycetaceae bacterium]
MASVPALKPTDSLVHQLGRAVVEMTVAVGDLALFGGQVVRLILIGLPRRGVMTQTFYEIGVRSIPVVAVTGLFIGMVLAIQAYDQFHFLHMETKLGAAINASLVRELGPTLAAVMLAGRVGSAMAAELGTMRVTEQIDALKALGANPIQYLVVPRFLACFLLIPLLTAIADAIGILGGWMIGSQVLGIDSFYWWLHSKQFIAIYDVQCGLTKSFFFGGAIALVSCYQGFHCGAGAEGVGQASTRSFVWSFIAILVLDFFLGVFQSGLYYFLWPDPVSLF